MHWICTVNYCGMSGFHSIGSSTESPSRSGVADLALAAVRVVLAREMLGETALVWLPDVETGLEACELSVMGFRGTAGGAFSKRFRSPATAVAESSTVATRRGGSIGFWPRERSAAETGEPVRSTVVATRLGGGAGFLSMVPCLAKPAFVAQSGSESGEKGLDLR